MADYWKSQPRKFCEFCKCWITDNKPSVEFHERGKRHNENVQRKIDEMRKKSTQKAKEQEELEEGMAQMEKAALEALRRDLANDPSLAAQYGVKLKTTADKEKSSRQNVKDVAEQKCESQTKIKEWFEAKSPEGYSYYWNISTNESIWEPPEDFVSLAEQEGRTCEEDPKTSQVEDPSSEVLENPQSTSEEESQDALLSETSEQTVLVEPPQKILRLDPTGARSSYGAWETVAEESAPEEAELCPPLSLEEIPLPGEVLTPVEENKDTVPVKKDRFKEKTIVSLGLSSGGMVDFKKRKIASGARNMRRRDDD